MGNRQAQSKYFLYSTNSDTSLDEKDEAVKTSRSSLKLLGTVGEPINPEAWRWYYDVVGNKNSEIVDTWWQTETGGILLALYQELLQLNQAQQPNLFGVNQ